MQTADYPSHSTFQAHLKKYTPQVYRSVCCPHDSVTICSPAKSSNQSITDLKIHLARPHLNPSFKQFKVMAVYEFSVFEARFFMNPAFPEPIIFQYFH